jgi:lysophospholipase L1-like esterase
MFRATYSSRKFLLGLLFGIGLSSSTVSVGQEAASEKSTFAIPATDDGLPGSGPIRRYDWFQNLWQSKRAEWSTRVQQDQNAMVFLGDSITQGWGDQFGGQFAELKTANRGISGDTTRGMLIRLKEDVLAIHPIGVVILMGTNDLEEGASPETIASNFKLIIEALKQHNSEMPIIVCQVFPSSASKSRPSDKIQMINKLYGEAVKDDSQITMVDTYELFADANGDAKIEEFPDLLHPMNRVMRSGPVRYVPSLSSWVY